ASISEADAAAAEREHWWGRAVPQEKATMVSASTPTPMNKRSPDDIAAAGSEATAEPGAGSETVVSSEPAEGQASARVTAPAAAKRGTRQPEPALDAPADGTGRWGGHWVGQGGLGDSRER